MDFKSTFLHGDLSKYFYMEQPLSFVTHYTLVCWFKNSLYGLNQSPWAWYAKIDSFFINIGFKGCECNHNIYVFHVHGDTLIIVVYVDDLVITDNNIWSYPWIEEIACWHLWNDISWYYALLSWSSSITFSNGILSSQSKYALDLLKHFKMENWEACVTPF